MSKRTYISPEKLEEIKRDYHNTVNAELAQRYGCSIYAINGIGNRYGLKKDKEFIREISKQNFTEDHPARKYWIKKGTPPPNKGKKQAEYMSPEMIERTKGTRFQKGHTPHNSREVGFERIDKDGYVMIKVEGKRKLVLKHRHVWETHNGSIPVGHNVQFKDGNKHNCNIENLYIISRSNQLKNENSLHTRYPEEVRKLIQIKGALNRQINKISRHE